MKTGSIALLLGGIFLGGCGSTDTEKTPFQREEQVENVMIRKVSEKAPVEYPLETHNYDLLEDGISYGFMSIWIAEAEQMEWVSAPVFEGEPSLQKDPFLQAANASILKKGGIQLSHEFSETPFSCNKETGLAKRETVRR